MEIPFKILIWNPGIAYCDFYFFICFVVVFAVVVVVVVFFFSEISTFLYVVSSKGETQNVKLEAKRFIGNKLLWRKLGILFSHV